MTHPIAASRRPGSAFASALARALLALLLLPAAGVAASVEEGRRVFETRCAACHTIGGGKLLGPDLHGIAERRERDWLVRFILAPDRLRQEGDPIALANVEQFGMPMLNLGWTPADVEAVVAFLQVAEPSAPSLPAPFLPTLAVAVLAVLGLTVISLRASSKRVEVRT